MKDYRVCRICKLNQELINFDLQSKDSMKRDWRCKECVKKIKRDKRKVISLNKDKLNYELNNKQHGYVLKICQKHGNLSYENIRLRIRVVKNKIQTSLSCIPCIKDKSKLQRGYHILESRINIDYLKCVVCKTKKKITYFTQSSLKDKYPKCADCCSYLSKKSFIQSKYKLSEENYNFLIKEQNNLCKICNMPEIGKFRGKIKRLSIDHCHKTGKIRGLLCSFCNVGLGVFKERSDLLYKAIRYLEREN